MAPTNTEVAKWCSGSWSFSGKDLMMTYVIDIYIGHDNDGVDDDNDDWW